MPDYKRNIAAEGCTIYDSIPVGDPGLWIPTPALEQILNAGLCGKSLQGLPLRTRSKQLKKYVCEALGYSVPSAFKKTRPRFPGQNMDTFGQKARNVQIFNASIDPERRYALIQIDTQDCIQKVRVVTGETLAGYDNTETLTKKYQARLNVGEASCELVATTDTSVLLPHVNQNAQNLLASKSPAGYPISGELLPIRDIFNKLSRLIDHSFSYGGQDQERTRGGALQRAVCEALGYQVYQDDGQFPDVKHQLLEVKLQTSPTIDLGIIKPDSVTPLGVPMLNGTQVRHCDTRYALFYGTVAGQMVTLKNLYVTTGESFYTRFQAFGGLVLNQKLQIPLPSGFFL